MKQVSRLHLQRGISLLESLVAIVVMALGILGILGVQMRNLADTQTSVRRAQAVRLIEDLGERMKAHPNALMNLASYTIGWNATLSASPAVNCRDLACSPVQLAAYDLWAWRILVRDSLPAADVSTFVAAGEGTAENRRQLGVMVSWRANEREDGNDYNDRIDTTKTIAADGSVTEAGGGVTCPTGRTCHLQYLPVTARCAPYLMGPTPQYFCPGPKV